MIDFDDDFDFDDDDDMNDDDKQDNDDEDNSSEEDNEHPYGDDPDDEKEEEGGYKGGDKKGVKAMMDKLKSRPNMKKMKAIASANDFGPHVPGLLCPGCRKATLFSDKIIPTGLRIATAIAKGCIGIFSAEKDLNLLRFVCLNSSCKHYWPRTGDKFMINVANPGQMIIKKNPYHINK